MSRETIVSVASDALKPGRLAQVFQGGAKAVILRGDQRIAQLWQGLCGGPSGDGARAGDARLPWESSLLNVARNHRAEGMILGDMFRYVPGVYAHSARKLIIVQDPRQQVLHTVPETFWHDERRMPLPQELLRTAWELTSSILSSVLPDGAEPPSYGVALERLYYPGSAADLEKICTLLADTGGTWTQIGQRVDAYKAMAVGLFDTKVLRDLFALSSLLPGVRPCLHQVNRFFKNVSWKKVSGEMRLVGSPHTDDERVFTALASDRETLITEVYDGRQWVELPLSPDTLAIFPSTKGSRFGMTPTFHRILMKEQPQNSALSKPNITCLLAVVERPSGVHSA